LNNFVAASAVPVLVIFSRSIEKFG